MGIGPSHPGANDGGGTVVAGVAAVKDVAVHKCTICVFLCVGGGHRVLYYFATAGGGGDRALYFPLFASPDSHACRIMIKSKK